MDELLASAGRTAAIFRAGLAEQRVAPDIDMAALRTALGGPLPTAPVAPEQVIAELVAAAEPGLMATAGPRFFGFVVGGSLPAATAADVLAAGWDQCAFNAVLSPAAAAAEEIAGTWLKHLLGLPPSARSDSSGAVRRPTLSGWHVVGMQSWPTWDGTLRLQACRARRRCGSSPASSGTPPSTARCVCSASDRTRLSQ
jgi:hypothetical protein